MTDSVPTSSSASSPIPAPRIRWASRVVAPAAILLAFASLFAGSLVDSLTPALEVQVRPVIERPAMRRSLAPDATEAGTVTVQAAGWIEPDPFPTYATALTDGTVEEVHFLEGDRVTRGDVLVQLIDEDARLELQRAEAEARAAEQAWEANIEVRRKAAVASAAVREVAASLELARAELQVQHALLKEAERIHERRASLLANGTISQEEFDITEAALAAQSARARVGQRRIQELEAKRERAEAEDTAAARHLELRTEERRRLEIARVNLADSRLRLDRLQVRAPISGVVMARFVEPGSQVFTASDSPTASRVAQLYDPRRLQVRVDVPLADAAKIQIEQRAQVVIEVLPDRVFTGWVTRITHRADIQKNTLEVKISLENPAAELRPEMLARVRFLKAEEPGHEPGNSGALSVFAPTAAVDGGVAWVVTQFDGHKGLADRRIVKATGATQEGWSEIESGLRPGDLLILSPPPNLQPQAPVRVRTEASESNGLH